MSNQLDDLRSHRQDRDVGQDIDSRIGLLRELGERAIDVGKHLNRVGDGLDPERTRKDIFDRLFLLKRRDCTDT
jgi:hypothetical protein